MALGTGILLADPDLLPIVKMERKLSHEEIDAANLSGIGSAICHPTVAMRREAVIQVGGYRAKFEWAEDLDLFLRLAEIGSLANLPDVLLTYRQHLASVGYSKRQMQSDRIRLSISDAIKRRNRGPLQSSKQLAQGNESYASIAEIHRQWGWLALGGGHSKTARKHAFKALVLQPFSQLNARLIACAVRGH